MSRFGYTLAILASSVLASACSDDLTQPDPVPPGSTSSGSNASQTFDHDNSGISPWDLLDRLTKEGPPKYTSRVHSCPKVRVRTLGNVMASVGINMMNATSLSAADLYNSGYNALGGPNYANRIRENIGLTTSGASREFDIFAAGAPEIITAFTPPNNTTGAIGTRCSGAELFNTDNTCRVDGITCLIGEPASSEHVSYCNATISMASDVTTGKKLAVAALLAAAYTCE